MYLLSQLSFDLHYNHCYIYLSIYILWYFLPRLQHIRGKRAHKTMLHYY